MEKGENKKGRGSGSKKTKKRALGRGLDALIPKIEVIEDRSKEYFQCDIELIRPNRYQPRLRFPEDEMEELSRSIKEQGIIQPLLVRKDHTGYELVSGERRLRAAKKVGLNRVPVLLKSITDSELLVMSIIENVQRQDLNPLEEAEAYYQLISEFDFTQDQAAERIGKSRSAIANFLRLRQLPKPIKASITDGTLSMGHARALLGAETPAQQNSAFRSIVAKGLSVRAAERLIKRLKLQKKKTKRVPTDSEQRYFLSLEEDLSRRFGTRVQIKKQGQKGTLEIKFYSDDDLDRVISLLKKI
ncbi:MAG: ParB/RepB/Spo0J family partition protein [Candidatus Desulfatibia sp.]|uniref:ParB/RepB/Spo0J family partition protein n=1 Tax=Candidatus Desulfatibia sp. TaxID=3101189 RepID=UPI002F2C4474